MTSIGLLVGPYRIGQFTADQNMAPASTRLFLRFPACGDVPLPIVIDTWMTWSATKEATRAAVSQRARDRGQGLSGSYLRLSGLPGANRSMHP